MESSSDRKPIVRESSTYLTDSEAASICTMFGDGLESGMSFSRIVDMLERQGYEKKIIRRLRHSLLEEGDMLGEAFARYGFLDATARKLVYVSEQQGKLPETFKSLAKAYEKSHKRRKKLVMSFIEPCILIMIGLILARNIFGADLETMLESGGIGDVVSNFLPIFIQSAIQAGIFSCIAFFTAMVFLNLPVDLGLRSTAYRLWLALPLGPINNASRLFSFSAFCQYTQQSITSGLTVHRALALAAEASNNPKIESRIPVAQKAIEEGRTLAAALYEADALPNEIIEYIDIGEEAGRLEERLAELANRYDERANEAFENSMQAFVYIMRFAIIIVVLLGLMLSIRDMLADTLPF